MKNLFFPFLASIIVICFFINIYLPFLIIAFSIYLWLLYKHSEIALIISILFIINCFSLISEDLLRLPYIFRMRDVFFLSTFFPLIVGIYKGDKRIKCIFANPIAKCIFLILGLAFSQIFITKLRFPEESFNSIIRTGRRYFYYAIFFPAFYVLLDKNSFTRFLKLFIGLVVIFCFLYIIQFLIGPAYKIFIWGRVDYQVLQGFRVTRMYIMGVIATTVIFHISYMLFMFYNKYRLQNIILLLLSGTQTLFTFGRAHIFGAITGILFGVACAKEHSKLKNSIKLFSIIFIILFLGELFSAVFLQQKERFIKAISSRVISTYDAVINKKDTFYFRIEDSLGRIELIKNNPIWGIGFVHDESRLFFLERGVNEAIRTTDSGIITLLLDFGILGGLWLFSLTCIIFKRGLYVYKKAHSQFFKCIILGILSFYFGRLFSFITLADFVTYDGIVILTLSMALIEIINYRTVIYNHESKRSIHNNS